MVFDRIVFVRAGLEQDAGFVGLVGLVSVHGPLGKTRQPERKRSGCHKKNHYQTDACPAIEAPRSRHGGLDAVCHTGRIYFGVTGLPHTSIST
ncbi:MAG: hypothetical protein AMXMBFR4_22490 [Candidatus Hydrogenedentota bacterium]